MTNALLEAAFAYADLGWRVVPLHPREKRPRPSNWPEIATDDHGTISRWWHEVPDGNVGVALGSGSGLVAIDVDSDEGSKLLDQMAAGDLPDTCEMTTGKGSRLLYGIPESVEVEPLQLAIAGRDGEALRFQGRGGQCVMPPSIHPSGRLYAWVEGRSPNDLAPASMPSWLMAEMTRPKQAKPADEKHDDEAPWADFNRRESWDAWLLHWGFKRAGGRGDVRYYTRPGKQSGVSVSVGHYRCGDGSPAMYVFSGSIPALPAGKAYDLFGAYARWLYSGDFSTAASALLAQGYGKRTRRDNDRITDLERRVKRLEALLTAKGANG